MKIGKPGFPSNCLHNRAATRDVKSVMKSLPWGKTVWDSYGKRAFSLLYVCCSAYKCHYDSRREGGEYYERSKVLQVDFGS